MGIYSSPQVWWHYRSVVEHISDLFFFYNIEQNIPNFVVKNSWNIFAFFFCLQCQFPSGSKAIEYVMLKWRRVLGSLICCSLSCYDTLLKDHWSTFCQLSNFLRIQEVHPTNEGETHFEKRPIKCDKIIFWKPSCKN